MPTLNFNKLNYEKKTFTTNPKNDKVCHAWFFATISFLQRLACREN